jgi:hypothetical protein
MTLPAKQEQACWYNLFIIFTASIHFAVRERWTWCRARFPDGLTSQTRQIVNATLYERIISHSERLADEQTDSLLQYKLY